MSSSVESILNDLKKSNSSNIFGIDNTGQQTGTNHLRYMNTIDKQHKDVFPSNQLNDDNYKSSYNPAGYPMRSNDGSLHLPEEGRDLKDLRPDMRLDPRSDPRSDPHSNNSQQTELDILCGQVLEILSKDREISLNYTNPDSLNELWKNPREMMSIINAYNTKQQHIQQQMQQQQMQQQQMQQQQQQQQQPIQYEKVDGEVTQEKESSWIKNIYKIIKLPLILTILIILTLYLKDHIYNCMDIYFYKVCKYKFSKELIIGLIFFAIYVIMEYMNT